MSEATHFEMRIDLRSIVVKCKIPGEPQSWERAGRRGNRSFDTKANIAAKNNIRWALKLAKPDLRVDYNNRFGVILLFATSKFNTDADKDLSEEERLARRVRVWPRWFLEGLGIFFGSEIRKEKDLEEIKGEGER
jgi:hypothetical protein